MNKQELQIKVSAGYSLSQLSKHFGKPVSSVRYWLKKYNLTTKSNWILENRYKYTDTTLIQAWKNSKSVNQFLQKLGVNNSGGAWYHYKNRLSNLGIRFRDAKKSQSLGGKVTAKQRNNQALQKKTRIRRSILHNALQKINTPYKCAACGIHKWRNKKS